MNTHADKSQGNKSQSIANAISATQKNGESSYEAEPTTPEFVAQKRLKEMANNSEQIKKGSKLQSIANSSPQAKKAAQLQRMVSNTANPPQTQIQKKVNKTGLPDNLKSGIETLSGYSLDDVQVHFNSNKPAQLQAHAYAQGTDIHLGTGQEKHLPHEAWHVVQQKQNRVKSTIQMKEGIPINDDPSLENEADLMGNKAVQVGNLDSRQNNGLDTHLQKKSILGNLKQLMSQFTPKALELRKQKKDAEKKKKAQSYIESLQKQIDEENVINDNDANTNESANSTSATGAGLGAAATADNSRFQNIQLQESINNQLLATAFEDVGGTRANDGLYIFDKADGYHISFSINTMNFHITREAKPENDDETEDQISRRNIHIYWSNDNVNKGRDDTERQLVEVKTERAKQIIERIRNRHQQLRLNEQKKLAESNQTRENAKSTIATTTAKKELAEELGLNAQNFEEQLSNALIRGWSPEQISNSKENEEFDSNNSQEVIQLKKNSEF